MITALADEVVQKIEREVRDGFLVLKIPMDNKEPFGDPNEYAWRHFRRPSKYEEVPTTILTKFPRKNAYTR